MEPFPMIVRHELFGHEPQVSLSEDYEMVQALVPAGLTRWQPFSRSPGVSSLPAVARRRRWWAVNDNLYPPVAASSCSWRTRLSSST